MNKKLFLKVSLYSILLFIGIMPVTRIWIGIDYSSLIGFIVYFILTMFCLKKYGGNLSFWQIPIALFVGRTLIDSSVVIYYLLGYVWSLPEYLVHVIGIICGFLYWRLKSPFNLLAALLGSTLAVFMFFKGYDLWLHKLNFGTFTGQVTAANLPTKFEAFDEQKNLIADAGFRNKIVLLDFWHTRCGICFEKFPQVEAVYNKYKNDSSVLILAVDKPLEEDKPDEAFQIIKREGYTFPVVVTKDEELPEKFGVKGYPTTFVINPNGQIVYKGGIEGAVKMVDALKREN